MSWTAIVPIKSPGDRKSRLADRLTQGERVRLSNSLLCHVLGVLQRVPAIAEIAIVSSASPAGWEGRWIQDTGRGLNEELQAAAALFGRNVLVIHADLPALTVEDVEALLAAASENEWDNGVAIAPDRHQGGTNAIAVEGVSSFTFSFGVGSFARHCTIAAGRGVVVNREGLALDIDFPEDFALAVTQGFVADSQANDLSIVAPANCTERSAGSSVACNSLASSSIAAATSPAFLRSN